MEFAICLQLGINAYYIGDSKIYYAHRVFTIMFGIIYVVFIIFSGLFLFSPNRDEEYDGIYDRLYYNEYRTGALYKDL